MLGLRSFRTQDPEAERRAEDFTMITLKGYFFCDCRCETSDDVTLRVRVVTNSNEAKPSAT